MKFYYYATIIVGIIILLNAAGMETPSGELVKNFNIVNSTGDISFQNFKSSPLWVNDSSTDSIPGITYLLTGALVAGLVLGAFGRAPDIRYFTATMVFVLAGFITSDMIFLFVQLNSYGVVWIQWLSLAIIAPLTIGFFISALEFWQGTD